VKIAIPPGTFPDTYTLSLAAACQQRQPGAAVGIAVSNQPPDAVNDAESAAPGTSVRIPVTRNDTDPDGDDGYKTALEVDPPTVGTATVLDNQTIQYTPGPGFVDGDQFGYRNCDLIDASGRKRDCGTAIVTVTKPDPVPVPDPDAVTKQETLVSILVTRNDTSPDPKRLRVWRDPRHGTAVVKQPRDGNIDYTREDGFTGEDSFEYDYCEGVVVGPTVAADACPRAAVTVHVEPPDPKAVDDPDVRTERDQPVDIDVMENDEHPVAARLQVLPQPAAQGTPVVQRDGIVRYTPQAGSHRQGQLRVRLLQVRHQPDRGRRLRSGHRHGGRQAAARHQDGHPQPHAAEHEGGGHGEHRLLPGGDSDAADPAAGQGRRQGGGGRQPGRQVRGRAEGPRGAPSWGPTRWSSGSTVTGGSGWSRRRSRSATGEDRFDYRLCDIVDAGGDTDCGSATVTVTVTDTSGPVIASVQPGSTPPGRAVEVAGNTGACGRAGTLALQGTGATATVTGDQDGAFTASLTVPPAIFPRPYRLELRVDCQGQPQRAEAELMVVNQAPVAADDQARTTPDASTAIDVTRNDRDPDDPDTYPTLLLVTDPPDHGTAEVRSDLSVVYTPEPGFTGEDRFVYSLCDDLLNPAGRPDCGEATVTVTVDPTACAPAAGQDPGLRVNPDRGRAAPGCTSPRRSTPGWPPASSGSCWAGLPCPPTSAWGATAASPPTGGCPRTSSPGPTRCG
jgi:hypothetical protein